MAYQQEAITKIASLIADPLAGLSDHELIREYVDRASHEAFAELFKRHSGMVYCRCMRTLNDRELANDVTQAVFLMLHKKAASLSEKTIVAGWLYKASKYASINALKSNIRKQQSESESGDHLMNVQTQNQDREEWNQILPHLDEVLDQLKEKYRNAIILRYLKRKSVREVGMEIGISEKAAESCLARALKKMQVLMQRRGIGVNGVVLAELLSSDMMSSAPKGMGPSIVEQIGKGVPEKGVIDTIAQESLKTMPGSAIPGLLIAGMVVTLGVGSAIGYSTLGGAKSIEVSINKAVHVESSEKDPKVIDLSPSKKIPIANIEIPGSALTAYLKIQTHIEKVPEITMNNISMTSRGVNFSGVANGYEFIDQLESVFSQDEEFESPSIKRLKNSSGTFFRLSTKIKDHLRKIEEAPKSSAWKSSMLTELLDRHALAPPASDGTSAPRKKKTHVEILRKVSLKNKSLSSIIAFLKDIEKIDPKFTSLTSLNLKRSSKNADQWSAVFTILSIKAK